MLVLVWSVRGWTGSTYFGDTGLILVPNGRVIEDANLRFTFSQTYPYRDYAVAFGFFPFLELNGRITEILNLKAVTTDPGFAGYGNYKDKSTDFKLWLLNENRWVPSLAIGTRDFQGTQLFFSEYIAASKKFGDFDFTLGYGGNAFGGLLKNPGTQFRELDGLFGGVEWQIIPKLSLLAEYDPADNLVYQSEQVKSHCNVGLRWKPFSWLDISYSYQRGTQHSAYVSFTYPFGKLLCPQYPETPFVGPVDRSGFLLDAPASVRTRLDTIRDILMEEGFGEIRLVVSGTGDELLVEYENNRYLSEIKAVGRLLRILAAQAPLSVNRIHAVSKINGVLLLETTVNLRDYIDFLNGKITLEDLTREIHFQPSLAYYQFSKDSIVSNERRSKPFSYSITPIQVEPFLNDPSGFFKARLGPAATLVESFGNGLTVGGYLKYAFSSDVSSTASPITDRPVRSDLADYLSPTGLIVTDLYMQKLCKFDETNYARFQAGYLELMFAGISAEYVKVFKDGRFGLGGQLSWAKKRSPDQIFGLEEFEAVTPFVNGYAFFPSFTTLAAVNAGRFLGGDYGAKFQITRFVGGGQVYLWYTVTDTHAFTGDNQGYRDKGVGFMLPLRVFKPRDGHGYYDYGISPWTRDVGEQVGGSGSLFGDILCYTPAWTRSHINELQE